MMWTSIPDLAFMFMMSRASSMDIIAQRINEINRINSQFLFSRSSSFLFQNHFHFTVLSLGNILCHHHYSS